MTPTEFKAWFDGFTEALSGTPNEDQWKRIKARVAEIDGRPITQQVYVDRYWPQRIYETRPHWDYHRVWMSAGNDAVTYATSNDAVTLAAPFNSIDAMYAAGKADAAH